MALFSCNPASEDYHITCDSPECVIKYTNDSLSLDSAFNTPSNGLFQALGPKRTGITFYNDVQETYLDNHFSNPYFMSSAVAVGDLDNDGLIDLLFKGSHKTLEIYRNLGGLKFENITPTTGIKYARAGGGITVVDINSDGLLDIYLSQASPNPTNLLYINQGNWRFKEMGEKYNLNDTSYTTSSAFFDYDLDGDLDLYLLNHCTDFNDIFRFNLYNKIAAGINTSDKFYVNDGEGRFTEMSKTLGINNHSYGLGLSVGDLNQDGYTDVLVGNDYLFPDQLFVNNSGSGFEDQIRSRTNRTALFGMGTAIADVNNDGYLDFFIAEMGWLDNVKRNTDAILSRSRSIMEHAQQSGYHNQISHNIFQLSNGDGSFSEISNLSGVDASQWSWTPLIADFDNDGFKDIFITNGFNYSANADDSSWEFEIRKTLRLGDPKEFYRTIEGHREGLSRSYFPNFIYQNKDGLSFQNKTDEWGLRFKTQSYGAAYADFDNDGDLDIAVSNINQFSFIYENKAVANYLRVNLIYTDLNKPGIGACVRVSTNAGEALDIVSPMNGFCGQSETILHFGLGKDTAIKSLEVLWPNGLVSSHQINGINQTIELNYSKSFATKKTFYKKPRPRYFSKCNDFNSIVVKEKEFSDFDKNYALIKKMSTLGSCLAVGDIDNDGIEDLFIGGGTNRFGMLLRQTQAGNLIPLDVDALILDKAHEDASAVFIDYDLDGDKDLVVCSSSIENSTTDFYTDGLLRIYTNDGTGRLTRSLNVVPELNNGMSGLSAKDFDKDGDIDLFVGNEFRLDQYPHVSSYPKILVNEAGTYIDKTLTIAPEMSNPSIHLSSALWTDYDNDGDYDLLGVGELNCLSLFNNSGGKFTLVKDSTLNNSRGLWNSINGADFDADGDIDYIIGNWGGNSSMHPSAQEPLTVYFGDFDANGNEETMITHFVQGKEYPIYPFEVFLKLLPNYKKIKTYGEYGKSSLQDLFDNETINGSYSQSANGLKSIYLQNNGPKGFSAKELPFAAQISTIFGILIDDYNQDGFPDVLCHGNFYGTDPTMDRMSESTGTLLLNDGKGWFVPERSINSGFWSRKEARGLVCMNRSGKRPIVLGTNHNDTISCYNFIDGNLILHVIDNTTERIVVDNGKGIRYAREIYVGEGYRSQRSTGILVGKIRSTIEEYDETGKLVKKTKVN